MRMGPTRTAGRGGHTHAAMREFFKRHPKTAWISSVIGGLVLIVVIFLSFFNWNYFRPMLARQITAHTGRPCIHRRRSQGSFVLVDTQRGSERPQHRQSALGGPARDVRRQAHHRQRQPAALVARPDRTAADCPRRTRDRPRARCEEPCELGTRQQIGDADSRQLAEQATHHTQPRGREWQAARGRRNPKAQLRRLPDRLRPWREGRRGVPDPELRHAQCQAVQLRRQRRPADRSESRYPRITSRRTSPPATSSSTRRSPYRNRSTSVPRTSSSC